MPRLQMEVCKLCSPHPTLLMVVTLAGPEQRRIKGDTGIGMLKHIALAHPEAIGLPSREEQLQQARRQAYQQELEKRLYERRN